MTAETDTRLERIFFWGRPFSPLYSCLMANRSSFYRKGIFRRTGLDVPVISVGNLVLGGTGKTPLVRYIAELLLKLKGKPAVLSRGYKGTATGDINVVSDGISILMDAEKAGDEPLLLAEKLPGVPVITGRKRIVTGRFAIDSLEADHLILDDGFQHLALKRDIDLVLFSGHSPLGNGRVLPGGNLREPLSALNRADAFIICGGDPSQDSSMGEFTKFLENSFPGKPVFTGAYAVQQHLVRVSSDKDDTMELSEAQGIPLFGFCGIGKPESFQATLRESGLELAGFQPFQDHHAYTEDDIRSLYEQSRSAGTGTLVTTEKDLVKVRGLLPRNAELLVLPVRLQMDESFDRFLMDRLEITG